MIEEGWRILGGRPLQGEVRPSGSKNGALPTLAAALLVDGEIILHNVPRIADVETMLDLLRAFGLDVGERSDGSLRLVNHGLATSSAPEDLVARMRASHYLLGPVVARLKQAELPLPGGCDIGDRPVGYLLAGLEALGVEAQVEERRILARAPRLSGAAVTLDPVYRSPGATFSVLMAAVLAEGATIIENASFEPDVISFCRFLNCAGARIEGIGSPTLTVTGVRALSGGTGSQPVLTHHINPDRLEAGTFLCAAAATRGKITVEGIKASDFEAVVEKLRESGVEVSEADREGTDRLKPVLPAGDEGLHAACPRRPRAVSVVTEPYPGFPTDLQPPLAAVLAAAKGKSAIRESIFDRRLQYAEQLTKMGAKIEVLDSREAAITGVPRLHAAEVEAHNIRDAAALVIAALSAEGESTVWGRPFACRGYEAFEDKLRALGARLEAIPRP